MNTRLRHMFEWAYAIVFAMIFVQLLNWYVLVPTQVKGYSMEPNFKDGQYVIVDRWAYWFSEPKRGDVIIFRAPSGDLYIKRVIALPGESVRVEGDRVYINGRELREHYIENEIQKRKLSGSYNTRDFAGTVVPERHVFVMGDNRSRSMDSRSRSVGTVPYEQIIGRADLTVWPLRDIHIIGHGGVEVLP